MSYELGYPLLCFTASSKPRCADNNITGAPWTQFNMKDTYMFKPITHAEAREICNKQPHQSNLRRNLLTCYACKSNLLDDLASFRKLSIGDILYTCPICGHNFMEDDNANTE